MFVVQYFVDNEKSFSPQDIFYLFDSVVYGSTDADLHIHTDGLTVDEQSLRVVSVLPPRGIKYTTNIIKAATTTTVLIGVRRSQEIKVDCVLIASPLHSEAFTPVERDIKPRESTHSSRELSFSSPPLESSDLCPPRSSSTSPTAHYTSSSRLT